jgi:hypothetical protein
VAVTELTNSPSSLGCVRSTSLGWLGGANERLEFVSFENCALATAHAQTLDARCWIRVHPLPANGGLKDSRQEYQELVQRRIREGTASAAVAIPERQASLNRRQNPLTLLELAFLEGLNHLRRDLTQPVGPENGSKWLPSCHR